MALRFYSRETARFAGAVARETKAGLIMAFPAAASLGHTAINDLMLSAQGGEQELKVSENYFPEITRYMAGDPYCMFVATIDEQGDTEFCTTHDAQVTGRGIAGHLLAWSTDTSLPLSVLGEPKLPPDDYEAPSLTLHANILEYCLRHRRVLLSQMSDDLSEHYGHDVNLSGYLQRLERMRVLLVDRKRPSKKILEITKAHRAALYDLIEIVELLDESSSDFIEKGNDAADKFMTEPEELRAVMAKVAKGNQRMNGARIRYSERLSAVLPQIAATQAPLGINEMACLLGIDPEDRNRKAKLAKCLMDDDRIRKTKMGQKMLYESR